MYVPTMADDPVDVIVASLKGGNEGQESWIDTHWSEYKILYYKSFLNLFHRMPKWTQLFH